EFPRFPAALSFLMALTPEEAIDVLEKRLHRKRQQLAEIEGELAWTQDGRKPPRIVLIEDEYLRAILAADVAWLELAPPAVPSGAPPGPPEAPAAPPLPSLPD